MTNGTFKKLFDRLPQGVFVFDDKLRVKFTNAAFRRSFSDKAKIKGSLSETLACGELSLCGASSACDYCAFYKVMKAAARENAEKTETFNTTVRRENRTDKISVRIRILPADKKGKLFLGLTDGSFQTEMEREMLSAKKLQQRL